MTIREPSGVARHRADDEPATAPTPVPGLQVPWPRTAPGAATVVEKYAAFISYSHDADREFATRLQNGIERFATDDRDHRAVRVFRDDANLAARPDLWDGIVEALASSRWLIVLASPGSAGSTWVGKEIDWWRRHRSPDRVLVVHTHGTLAWSAAISDFDAASSTALHPRAVGLAGGREPRVIDARPVAHAPRRERQDAFESVLADVAATVRGVDKDTIRGEHLAVRRRAIARGRRFTAAVSVFAAASLVAGTVAVVQLNEATTQATIASARAYAAEADAVALRDPALAAHLALAAYRMDPSASAMTAVLHAYERAAPVVRVLETAAGRGGASGREFPDTNAEGIDASADGRLVAVGAYGGGVRVWERDTGGLVGSYPSSGYGKAGTVGDVSDDGRFLATSEGVVALPSGRPVDPGLAADLAGPTPVERAYDRLRAPLSSNGRFAYTALAEPARRWVSLSGGTTVRVHDLSLGTVISEAAVAEGAGHAGAIGVAGDGSAVVVGDDEGRVTVLDGKLRTQRLVARMPAQVHTIVVTDDGATATVMDSAGAVSVLRLRDARARAPVPGSGPHVDPGDGVAEDTLLARGPDEGLLLVSRPSGVELRSAPDGRVVAPVPVAVDPVDAAPPIAVDHVGRRFAVLGGDGFHVFGLDPVREIAARPGAPEPARIDDVFAELLGPEVVRARGSAATGTWRSPSGRTEVRDGLVVDTDSERGVSLGGGMGRGSASAFAFADRDGVVLQNVVPDRDSRIWRNRLQLWHRETGTLIAEWDDDPSRPSIRSQPGSVVVLGDTVALTVGPDGALAQRVVAPSAWARRLCEVHGEPTDQVRRERLSALGGTALCAPDTPDLAGFTLTGAPPRGAPPVGPPSPTGPTCPAAPDLAARYRPAAGERADGINTVLCSGRWAVALVTVSVPSSTGGSRDGWSLTAVYRHDGDWEQIDVTSACSDPELPADLRRPACETN